MLEPRVVPMSTVVVADELRESRVGGSGGRARGVWDPACDHSSTVRGIPRRRALLQGSSW